MEDKIAVLIPTRKRLDDFKIFADSWCNTTENKSVVIAIIDEGDNTYDQLIKEKTYPFIWEVSKSKPFLHILNDIAVKYCNTYNYLAFLEDDAKFNSYHWETRIIDKLKELGNTGFVWCDDMLNKQNLIGIPFINSKIVQKLGFMSRPEFNTQFVDGYWTNLAKKLETLYYFEDIVIEHRHFTTGKRDKDDTSIKVFNESVSGKEEQYFKSNQYQIDFINDYEKLKLI